MDVLRYRATTKFGERFWLVPSMTRTDVERWVEQHSAHEDGSRCWVPRYEMDDDEIVMVEEVRR